MPSGEDLPQLWRGTMTDGHVLRQSRDHAYVPTKGGHWELKLTVENIQ